MLDANVATTPRWLVCHTKPRCEKKFAALLLAAGISHYLPLLEKRHAYASGIKQYSQPLFPGYVFAQVSAQDQKRLYEQQLVVRTFGVGDEALFLRQLEQVRQVLHAGVTVALKPLLAPGKPVRIVTGPLRGLEGFVENSGTGDEVVLRVDVLQKGLIVSVPVESLKTLS